MGAVIVDSAGHVIGEGSHTFEGIKHAEVLALEQAGDKARGATLYINLEPCSHQGRTGACADAVIAAGVRRVVACMQDPNPLVAGKGFERLRNAGISVASGILQEEAKALNEAFAKYIRQHTPLVTLKSAMTLDGKIAPPPGELHHPAALGGGGATGGWITSDVARAHVQQLRHCHDAIMVGVGTIIADDPLLTDRSGLPRRRPLLRVIVDSRLRLPPESRVVKTAKDDVLVLCSFAEEKRKAGTAESGNQGGAGPGGSGRRPSGYDANRAPPGDDGNHQPAGRGRSHDQRRGAGLGHRGQGISLLRAQNSGRDRFGALCHRPRLRPHERGGIREGDPAAPFRRRFCGRRIFARPVRRSLVAPASRRLSGGPLHHEDARAQF